MTGDGASAGSGGARPEPRLRPARPEDLPAMLEMIAASLGPAITPALWRWKHEENPFGRSPCLIAEVGGEPVAVRAFMRWTWTSGGRQVPAVRAVDTATRPDWRGRGLFSRLTLELVDQMAEEGVSFVFNTPNANSRPGYLKLGWQVVAKLPLWLRPPRPRRRGSPLAPVAELVALPELDAFLDGCHEGEETRYHTRPAREILAWRYAAAPDVDYRALWRLDGGRGAALVVREKPHRRFTETRLVELLATADPHGRRAARRILGELAGATGGLLTAAAAPGTVQRGVLWRAGFLPVPRLGPFLTARRLSPAAGEPDPLSWSSWACSLGDLELF